MSAATQQIFNEWRLPLPLTFVVTVTGLIYIRGWLKIRVTRSKQFTALRVVSFVLGLLILWLAIGSPLDGFADALLSAHMVEHLLLMSVVPPLLLLGLPVVPLLRGLPEVLLKPVGLLISAKLLRTFGHWLVTPLVAWLAMNLAFLVWHVPTLYDFALEHDGWHVVEHFCFLSTALLFWWCILRPWPASPQGRNWGILFYLIAADVVNTLLSAFLSFCGRPVYSFYVEHPNPFNLPPLEDQVLGAVIMWVFGSLAFLLPAVMITVDLLTPKLSREGRINASSTTH